MITRLQKLLAACGVDVYSIQQKQTLSREVFFIRQNLDQSRAKDVTHTKLTVYKDFEQDGKKMRGSASKEIYPTEDDEQIKADIEAMAFNASLVANPWYPLVKDQKAKQENQKADLTSLLKQAVSALQAVADTDTEKLNSYEIFVNQRNCRIVNSDGVDVAYSMLDEMIEVIITSIGADRETELYHQVVFADQPLETIKAGIQEVFVQAHDRLAAQATKKNKAQTVIISGDDNAELFDYFMEQTNVGNIYMQMSQAKVGDVLQQADDDTDRITLQVRKNLPGSAKNQPYSDEGVPAQDVTLIENGTICHLWGPNQYAYYLGVKDSAPANNFVISGGSVSLDQMNPQTGDGGGEIRLAYWFDGKTITPVTGGSITFNIRKAMKHLRMSKESRQVNNALVPQAVQLFDVAVSGEE